MEPQNFVCFGTVITDNTNIFWSCLDLHLGLTTAKQVFIIFTVQ